MLRPNGHSLPVYAFSALIALLLASLSYADWSAGLSSMLYGDREVVAAAALACVLTFVFSFVLATAAASLWKATSPRRRVLLAFLAFLAVSASLLWTAVFYPGIMSNDSMDQWSQALANRYTTHHPPLMAMLMHATQYVTESPALFALLQGWLLWLSLFLAFRAGLSSHRRLLIACAVAVCDAAIWPYTCTLWKDVWTASCVLFSVPFFVRAIDAASARSLLAAAAWTAAAVCFRYNAVTLLAVPLLIGWRWTWRGQPPQRKAFHALGIAAIVLLPVCAINALPVVSHAGPPRIPLLAQYIGVVARLDRAGAEYALERGRFDAMLGSGKLDQCADRYFENPPSWDYMVFGRGRILDHLDVLNRGARIQRAAVRLSLRHPMLALRHRARGLSLLLQFHPRPVYAPYVNYTDEDEDIPGVAGQSLLPHLKTRALQILDAMRDGILFRHYLFLLWMAGCLVFLAHRTPVLVCSLLGLCYFIGFVFGDSNPDWRYLFTCHLCGLVAGLTWLLGRWPAGAKTCRPKA